MPYTLVPIIDVGPSRIRPGLQQRMPLGLDEGGYSIHLGPDRALVWTPADLADVRATKLADSADEVAAVATRTALNNLRLDGRALPSRAGDALADLLVTPPRGLWNPLVATKQGKLEVRLGPGATNVIWSQRVAPRGRASKDIQDDFNRSGNLDGSTTSDAQTTWVEDVGTGWTVDGDEADISGNVSLCSARLALAMDTADHYAQADLSRYSRNNQFLGIGVFVRADATPTSGYAFEVTQTNGPTNKRRVFNFVTDADIASDTVAPATGLLYLELNGSTYTAKLAGTTIFTGTDTAHAGSVKGVGIQAFSADPLNTAGYTSFRAADLVVAEPHILLH